jgi:hypothetical protein
MSSAVVNRSIIVNNGIVFSDEYRVLEDKDFFVRIASVSRAIYLPETLSFYRVHDDSETNNNWGLFSTENAMLLKAVRDGQIIVRSDKSNKIVDQLERKVAVQGAISSWRAGDSKRAREILRVRIFNAKSLLVYLTTFLPSKCFDFVSVAYLRIRSYFSPL